MDAVDALGTRPSRGLPSQCECAFPALLTTYSYLHPLGHCPVLWASDTSALLCTRRGTTDYGKPQRHLPGPRSAHYCAGVVLAEGWLARARDVSEESEDWDDCEVGTSAWCPRANLGALAWVLGCWQTQWAWPA